MKKKEKAAGLIVASMMLVLIIDSRTSLAGCQEGVTLCIKSVVPSLFPFLVLSPVLTGLLQLRLPKWLQKIIKLPDGADALVIAGCLGGYPVGAQCIANAVSSGQITRQSGQRLMAFCCNCGPGFIFGICAGFFTDKWVPWALWLCHIGSALILGAFIPGKEVRPCLVCAKRDSFMAAFQKAIYAMAQICGWVILFRCILAFLQKWVLWRAGAALTTFLTGAMELTNGCFLLNTIANEGLRFVICEAMLSFGGICVAMQTASVTRGLGLGYYLSGKLGQMTVSSLLAYGVWAIAQGKWIYTFGIFAALAAGKLIFGKIENISRNLRPVGV